MNKLLTFFIFFMSVSVIFFEGCVRYMNYLQCKLNFAQHKLTILEKEILSLYEKSPAPIETLNSSYGVHFLVLTLCTVAVFFFFMGRNHPNFPSVKISNGETVCDLYFEGAIFTDTGALLIPVAVTASLIPDIFLKQLVLNPNFDLNVAKSVLVFSSDLNRDLFLTKTAEAEVLRLKVFELQQEILALQQSAVGSTVELIQNLII